MTHVNEDTELTVTTNRYLVHLNEYLLEVDMPVVSGRGFEPGDQLLIRIEKAHARSGTLDIAPV